MPVETQPGACGLLAEGEPQTPVEITPIRQQNFNYAVNVTDSAVAAFIHKHPNIPDPIKPDLGEEVLQASWVWIATGPIRARAAVCTQLTPDSDKEFYLGVSSYLIENVVFERMGNDDFNSGVTAAKESEKWDKLWVNKRRWNIQELLGESTLMEEFNVTLGEGLERAFEDREDADIIMIQHQRNLSRGIKST